MWYRHGMQASLGVGYRFVCASVVVLVAVGWRRLRGFREGFLSACSVQPNSADPGKHCLFPATALPDLQDYELFTASSSSLCHKHLQHGQGLVKFFWATLVWSGGLATSLAVAVLVSISWSGYSTPSFASIFATTAFSESNRYSAGSAAEGASSNKVSRAKPCRFLRIVGGVGTGSRTGLHRL